MHKSQVKFLDLKFIFAFTYFFFDKTREFLIIFFLSKPFLATYKIFILRFYLIFQLNTYIFLNKIYFLLT